MKIKMLPNWCKKLGVFLFLLGFISTCSISEARKSYLEGYYSYENKQIKIPEPEPIFIEQQFGKIGLHVMEVVILLGLLFYMMSKEKVEDDYINKLRLETYQIISIFGIFCTVILYIFFGNLKLSLDYFINLFLIFYLIIFAIKKRLY